MLILLFFVSVLLVFLSTSPPHVYGQRTTQRFRLSGNRPSEAEIRASFGPPAMPPELSLFESSAGGRRFYARPAEPANGLVLNMDRLRLVFRYSEPRAMVNNRRIARNHYYRVENFGATRCPSQTDYLYWDGVNINCVDHL